MKKILTVSLCAIMAVSAARADIASVEYVGKQTGVLTDLTTTAKGNLVGAINELNSAVGTKAAQADFNTLQNTVTTNENDIEGKVSALSKTVTDNKATADKTQQDLDTLEATVAGLQGTGDTAAATKGELNALDARVGTAEGEIDALQASLATGGDTQKAIAAAQAKADQGVADAAAAQAAAGAAQATADKAVVANTAITAGTATKITYDAKGLVTKGEALTATDIPTIGQDKVSGLTAALAAKEASANKAASTEAATTIGKTVAYPTVSFMEEYVGQMTNDLISDVGDTSELTTENTDSLVDAINEVDANADAAAVAASNAQLAADAKLATVSSTGSGVVKTVVKDGTTVKVTAGTVALNDMAANSVDSSKIVDASVTKTDLATTVQTSLGLADTAMQESALKGLASWTSAKCGTTGVTCSLVSKDGNIAWEAVKY